MGALAKSLTPPAPFNVWLGEAGETRTAFYRDGSDYVVEFPGIASFRLSPDGEDCQVDVGPGTTADVIAHLDENLVVPLRRNLGGRLSFHAAVVAGETGAVALLGPSGAGKSTLAAHFQACGWDLLADDVLKVDLAPDAAVAIPHGRGVRLWPESNRYLDLDEDRLSPGVVAGKLHLALPQVREGRLLTAAFFLADTRPERSVIDRMGGAELVHAWTRNAFLLDIQDARMLSDHLAQVTRLSAMVPAFRLGVGDGRAGLADAAQLIADLNDV